MFPPTPNPVSSSQPLPLFRAEAVAAQQQKFYGEILLIRPFSLTLLVWMGIGISTVVLGFLLLGTTTEKANVSAVLLPGGREADLFLPPQTVKFVRLGQSIQIRCRLCPQTEAHPSMGTIREISKTALSSAELKVQMNTAAQAPTYRVKLILPQDEGEPFPQGARVEASLPVGRKPLLKWLFERGEASSWETGKK